MLTLAFQFHRPPSFQASLNGPTIPDKSPSLNGRLLLRHLERFRSQKSPQAFRLYPLSQMAITFTSARVISALV